MYCGNNRLHTTGKTIGTRYECLQRGIRYGKSLPVDPAYAGEYNPIDMRKFYCGKSDTLPEGYHDFGSNAMCFSKGIGVGKSIRAKNEYKAESKDQRVRFEFDGDKNNSIYYVVYLCIIITVLVARPAILTVEEKKDEKIVRKFSIPRYLFFCIALYLVFFL